jgi:hypothetical protein
MSTQLLTKTKRRLDMESWVSWCLEPNTGQSDWDFVESETIKSTTKLPKASKFEIDKASHDLFNQCAVQEEMLLMDSIIDHGHQFGEDTLKMTTLEDADHIMRHFNRCPMRSVCLSMGTWNELLNDSRVMRKIGINGSDEADCGFIGFIEDFDLFGDFVRDYDGQHNTKNVFGMASNYGYYTRNSFRYKYNAATLEFEIQYTINLYTKHKHSIYIEIGK